MKSGTPISGERAASTREPVVSCITTFLNAERFIAETIESVLAQTYGPWELLLIDDGSSDGSTEIAKAYATRHPDRIRYLEHDGHRNRGTSASRNVAIAAARGEYVAFLDADDVWLPNKLEDQIALFEAHPEAGTLYCNSLYWYSWSGRPEDRARDYYPPLGIPGNGVVAGDRLLELTLRGRVAVPCPTSVLVRTAVIRRTGGFDERFTSMFDDQVLYAKLFLAGPVLVLDGSWELYRIHDDSCCAVSRREGKTAAARLRYLEWMETYLSTTAAPPAVHSALRRALRPYRHPHLHSLQRLATRLASGVRRRAGALVGRAGQPASR